jgi:N-acetylmuramoyl-L-alanine amidase
MTLFSGWLSRASASDEPAPTCSRAGYRVALDSGHGPKRTGATSARGKTETSFNTRLTREALHALHEAGFLAAFHVNPDGTEVALTERTQRAAAGGAELFISIHHDSVQEHYLRTWTHEGRSLRHFDGFSGYSLFINLAAPNGKASRAFGEDLGHALLAAGLTPTLHHAENISGERRELIDQKLGLYRFDALAVLQTAQSPALLLEVGVLVNRQEEALLEQADHRAKFVAALMTAVEKACRAHGMAQP